jgi:hypothetical protein
MDANLEWGRAYRGRLWHAIRTSRADTSGVETDITFCNLGHPLAEVTLGQPPFGAVVCDRCEEAIQDIAEAVRLARDAPRPPVRTLDNDGPVH